MGCAEHGRRMVHMYQYGDPFFPASESYAQLRGSQAIMSRIVPNGQHVLWFDPVSTGKHELTANMLAYILADLVFS